MLASKTYVKSSFFHRVTKNDGKRVTAPQVDLVVEQSERRRRRRRRTIQPRVDFARVESQRRSGWPVRECQVLGWEVRYICYVRYNVKRYTPLALRHQFFSLRGRILRAGPPGPPCFLVFVFSPPPSALEAPGHPLTER